VEDPITINDSEVLHVDSVSIPRISGDGKRVLMQFQAADSKVIRAVISIENLFTLVSHLANIHTAALVQQWLPDKLKTSDAEFVTPPETHTSETGQLIYGDDPEGALVSLRVQTEEGRVLLINFDTGDFDRIVQTVRTLDAPQDLSGPAN
jgi:hypothetical protein